MFEVRNLKIHGVESITLSLSAGKFLAIEGPSGSGKTLLLRALADLDPVEGERSLDGKSYIDMSGPEWRLQVRYNAAESGWWSDIPADCFMYPNVIRKRLHEVGLDEKCLDRPLIQLSTGERQRLSLLRVLEGAPKVLLLDEPTGALDPEGTMQVETLLQGICRTGISVMIVTHDKAQSVRLADRKMTIRNGRVEFADIP